MSADRHQTVTKTEHLWGVLRKSCSFNPLWMRRAGIEPATYSLRAVCDRTRSWFSPLRTSRDLVRILLGQPRKGNRNRNATVTAYGPSATCKPQLSVIRVTPFRARKPRLNGGVKTGHLVPLAQVSGGVPQGIPQENPPSIYDQPLSQLTPIWRWL